MVAEDLVASELAGEGWLVLARNWRGGGGELDLVVWRPDRLRFVEVKLRLPEDTLSDDALTHHKLANLRRAASAWLVEHGELAPEHAFLVAFVDGTTDPWSVRWIDDAFDG
ncbi:MAG: YraN family protein [Myxococcota bacterium]